LLPLREFEMWTINAPKARTDPFESPTLHEVLYEFERPRIFTTLDAGLLHFWYQCGEDEDSERVRYLVVPASHNTITKLKEGTRTVHDVLAQPWIWAVETDFSRQLVDCWVLGGLDEVPTHAKPKPHVMLWPHLKPLLSYRLIGPTLTEGHVPASVIARATERPAAALKRLFEYTQQNGAASGRPDNAFRRTYDLPARRIAFNSFEVSFGAPDDVEDLLSPQAHEALYRPGAEQLDMALRWMRSDHRAPLPLPLLEVLLELAPPAHGAVTSAEITGQLVGRLERMVLTRDDRSAVAAAIGHRRETLRQLVREEGRIGSFDRDNLTLVLRDRQQTGEDLRCEFDDEHFDPLWEAFGTEARVVIFGMMNASGRYLKVIALDTCPSDLPLVPLTPTTPR
jgi:hypothetical protein